MLRHKNIDRICCIVLALTLLLSGVYVGAAAAGLITADNSLGYETRLFDQSRVHTIDIVMQDWDDFIATCTSEEYSTCHLVIDGESYKNVAIRAKGNTSLSSVAAYGNNRYSFKVEFDHYQSGKTYYGLDKLCLNNIIQDNTYMKDYFAYTLMAKMGVASPLCSFVQVNVNGESWGLYLAVEGIEEGFLQRNYGKSYGELYKPDSLSFGGGRGNGRDFDMNDMAEQFGFSTDEDGNFDFSSIAEQFGFSFGDGTTTPDADGMPAAPDGMDFSSFGGSSGGSSSATADPTAEPTTEPTSEPTATPAPTANASDAADSSGASSGNTATDGTSSGMPANGNFTMPDGTVPADMPTDGNFTMPDGFDPNQMMGSSGESAATPAPSAEVSAPADMPDASDTPAQADSDRNDRNDRNDRKSKRTDSEDTKRSGGFSFGGFGGGGGFGMGSSDVKLQYIDDDPDSYSNIFNNAKTDVSAKDKARLIASLKTLSEGDASVVDQDAVIRYMAVHNFLCNDDSYTGMMVHNYYLYEKDGVLSMIPWDYNLAFGTMTGSNATSAVNTSISRLVSSGTDSDRPMAGWITASEEYTAEYYAIYREFITEVFDSGWFAEEIDRVIEMISPYVESDPTAFCTYAEFQTAAQTLKSFVLKRAESITRQLDGDTTQVDASGLELSVMGSMNGGGGGGGGGFNMPTMPTGDFQMPDTADGGFQMPDMSNTDFQMPEGMDFSGLQPDANAQIPAQGDTPAQPDAADTAPADAPDPSVRENEPDTPSEKAEKAEKSEKSEKTEKSGEKTHSSRMPTGNSASAQDSRLSAWGWVAICAALLLLALIFAKCFKTNR